MTINIVPSAGTIPRTGKFGVVANLPGLVTLTASDPACVLTPSSFTVGGTSENYCQLQATAGLARRDRSFIIKDNCAIGFEFLMPPQPFATSQDTYFYGTKYYGTDSASYCQYLMYNLQNRKFGFYSGWAAPTSGTFTKVFTRNTWYRIVFEYSGTSVIMTSSDSAAETLTRGSIAGVNPYDVPAYDVLMATRIVGGANAQQPLKIRNFQLLKDALPTAEAKAAFLAGTGDISAALHCKLSMQEESGIIAYDSSGNGKDFTIETPYAGTVWQTAAYNGLTRDVTGLTNQEQSISYDTTTIAPGTAITITATRTKAGFPTGRTPDISVESDTAVFTVAPVSVTGITLNKASALLDIGDTTTLTATVWPK